MGKIRVILIEDSSLMRLVTADLLSKDGRIELVSIAKNGKEGVEQVLKYKPDVLITDYLMPGYDGLYVVKELMKIQPLPIVVLSALEKTTPEIFEVLKAGAFSFVEKPKRGGIQEGESSLILTVLEAAASNVKIVSPIQLRINTNSHTFDSFNYEIIAIGASTGGPSAIESILEHLPVNLEIPVVIAQHMPERFLTSFSIRLNNISPLEVVLAYEGLKLEKGKVYVLPAQNLKVARIGSKKIFINDDINYTEFNNPSVNGLFLSIAKVYERKAIGVILTGMGKDGTLGVTEIRNSGGYTIAQDEKSSIVYGMPKSAVDSGAIIQSVSIKEIPNFLISCL